MRVMSVPSCLISAFPISISKYSSGTSPLVPYRPADSANITGLGSLIEDLSNPSASFGLEGATTFKPGTSHSQVSKL